MTTAAEMEKWFPRETWGFPHPDYSELLEKGSPFRIVLEVTDDDYQGDTRAVFKHDDGRYGWRIFGWGSCSGCDALQACDSYEDLAELRDELIDGIEWHESLEALKERFRTKDWEVEYAWLAEETRRWVRETLEMTP